MAKKKKAEKPVREYTRRQLSSFKRQKRRQRIILISGISIIAAVVIIIFLGWLVGEYLPMHRTILKVNDVEIDVRYYIDMLKVAQASNPNTNLTALSSNLPQQIVQNELIRQTAAKEPINITISDEEAKELMEGMGFPVSEDYLAIVKPQLLQERLRMDYFSTLVPDSAEQVNTMIMKEGENENHA